MDRSTVLAKLRDHRQELEAAGIRSLSIFGSVARGDSTAASDVDLMAEFDRSKVRSLFQIVHLRDTLTETLGVPVDLSSRSWLKRGVLEDVQREAVVVF